MSQEQDRKFEAAQGGIAHVDGDVATFGNGRQAWLNGTAWARAEANTLISPQAQAMLAQRQRRLA